jgi:hypothetical protein
MDKFKPGDIVICTKIKGNPHFKQSKYPQLGWEGTIKEKYWFDKEQYVICWDEVKCKGIPGGNLIYEWMIDLKTPKPKKVFGIAKFMESLKNEN